MPYEDYNNLLLMCQNYGQYRVFTFDIVNSSKMNTEERTQAQLNIRKLIERTYQDLYILGFELRRQILLDDIDGFRYEQRGRLPHDWFEFGDAVGLTIHNKSINPQVVYTIFNMNKDELQIDLDFHYSTLAYETNDYTKGSRRYYRGYAIQSSLSMHKEKNKDIISIITSIIMFK